MNATRSSCLHSLLPCIALLPTLVVTCAPSSKLLSEEVEERTFHLYSSNDPERLIRSGFWPEGINMGEPWMTNWFNGMDDLTNEFWTTVDV